MRVAYKFFSGMLLATPGVLNEVPEPEITEALNRHLTGDWGDVCKEDWKMNDYAVENRERILSSFTSKENVKFWIITESDRSATTVLLPSEY